MLGEFSVGDSALHVKNDSKLPQMVHYNKCHSPETTTKIILYQKIPVTGSLSHADIQHIYNGYHFIQVFSSQGKIFTSEANTYMILLQI